MPKWSFNLLWTFWTYSQSERRPLLSGQSAASILTNLFWFWKFVIWRLEKWKGQAESKTWTIAWWRKGLGEPPGSGTALWNRYMKAFPERSIGNTCGHTKTASRPTKHLVSLFLSSSMTIQLILLSWFRMVTSAIEEKSELWIRCVQGTNFASSPESKFILEFDFSLSHEFFAINL